MTRLACAAAALAVLLLAAVGLLRESGRILAPDEVAPDEWPVFGVDVSSYQGTVDWAKLARQGVDFAFIKATEGSGMQDAQFQANWAAAPAAGIRAGAYHFFSYDSPGESQADNFIAAVPVTEGALPPAVDLEFYGPYLTEPAEREHTRAILDALLARLEEHYGVKPILYVTYESYWRYVAGAYQDHLLWFSSPGAAPLFHRWTFWQYSHSAQMAGYDGHQRHIDLNVFRGGLNELQALTWGAAGAVGGAERQRRGARCAPLFLPAPGRIFA